MEKRTASIVEAPDESIKKPVTLQATKRKFTSRRMNTYVKVCPFCNEEFTCYNRRRKWCPDSNCKSMFYNLKNLEIYHRNKDVVNINEKNRNILLVWRSTGKKVISEIALDEIGFVFDGFHKHTYGESIDPVYEFLDFGLKDLKNGSFEIISLKKLNSNVTY